MKGSTMKSKVSTILCAAGIMLSVVFLIGANPGVPTQWEYGLYTESIGYYDWQEAARRVQTTDPVHFFEKMGFPRGIEVDARTGRVPTLVLNYLGRQGWELVEMRMVENRRDAYWFKRPK